MHLTVNGRHHAVEPGDLESLGETLRSRLHLSGTKLACERGECGACTVLLDGLPVYSCLALTRACEGRSVRTVEGVTPPGEALHPLQAAFVECDAVQCGFCTPGQVMAALGLLERNARPTYEAIAAAMSGNLCRCGTYPNIVKALHMASDALAAGPTSPASTDEGGHA